MNQRAGAVRSRCYHFLVSLPEEIKRSALEAGFDLAGIAPINACYDLEFAREWVDKGCPTFSN